jgi:nucleoside-diphosphate-sugar epimerase
MKILVTGANGFVGQALCAHLHGLGHTVVAQSRSALLFKAQETPYFSCQTADLTTPSEINKLAHSLAGCQAVVHTAARVHQVRDSATDPLQAYRQTNCVATLALARLAAQHGVQRFVFLSSIKVNGEFSAPGQPFRADDAHVPIDPYALSKWEAEQGLREIASATGMQVVIVRPPLVYGPGVKANFLTMMRWLQRGLPLPLGAIQNQRSLVGLGNLVDVIEKCTVHAAAAQHTLLVSDGQDVSTTELLRAMAQALHVSPRLVPIPQALLERSLQLLGRAGMAQRLCGDLSVDIAATRHLLDWTPRYSLAQGLAETAADFLRP